MIYLLNKWHGTDKKTNWKPDYLRNLKWGLDKIGARYKEIDNVFFEFRHEDVLIIVDYDDLWILEDYGEEVLKPLVITHSHGTGAIKLGKLDEGRIDRERRELQNVDIVTCNTKYQAEKLRTEFAVNAHYTGYPVDFGRIKSISGRAKEWKRKYDYSIVVAGRLGVDRQLYLAVEALKEYKDEVLFAVPHSKDKAQSIWGVDTINRYEDMFNFKWDCSQEEYYEVLKFGDIIATFGCVDTMNLSVVEGLVTGLYPLVPDKKPYLEYVSEGYEPYSIKDIRGRIESKPKVDVEIEKYRLNNVMERYVDLIEKHGGEIKW